MKEKFISGIKIMCELNNIKCGKRFLDFVSNKRLDYFSISTLKKLRKEYDER